MINMPWSFTIFLLFTCYFLDRWNWVSLGQGSYPKPWLQVSPGSVIPRGWNLTFRCAGPYPNVRFLLYNGGRTPLYQDPPGAEAVFLIADVTQEAEGTYTCRYHPKAGPVTYSEPSDPIQIRVRGDYQSTTTGNYQSTQIRRDSMPSEKDETFDKNDNTSTTIIISVVCAALLVIVLIIAAVFYCKWKGKKVRGDIQKSTLTVSEEAPATAVEPMYATVAGGKEDDSVIVPDVEQQTKGEDSEGLTYATINKEALKKKKKKTAAPSSYEPESTLYAAVNVH